MKKVFSAFIILTLLSCCFMTSCSADRKTETVSDRNLTESIEKNTMSMSTGTSSEGEAVDNTELVAPQLNYTYSQADERFIYYIYYNEIRKWNRETGDEETIYEGEGILRCIEKYQNFLYFIEVSKENSSLQFLNLFNPRLNMALQQPCQRMGFFDSFE